MVKKPQDYKWSSAAAHLQKEDDILVRIESLLQIVRDWDGLLSSNLTDEEYETLHRYERTGRPLSNDAFVADLEKLTDRIFHRQKPCPKRNN